VLKPLVTAVSGARPSCLEKSTCKVETFSAGCARIAVLLLLSSVGRPGPGRAVSNGRGRTAAARMWMENDSARGKSPVSFRIDMQSGNI